MSKSSSVVAIALALLIGSDAKATPSCSSFDALVAKTYGFRPAKLSPTEREKKTAGLDRFWNDVKSKRAEWLPCLRAALRDPKRDGFFVFDGAALLRSLSDTPEDRQIYLDSYRTADLEDVSLAQWVQGLARLGYDGADTSAAAARWFTLKEPSYSLPAHATIIGMDAGAWFLFGSMDERYATPTLRTLVAQAKTPEIRSTTIALLVRQYTQDSYQAIAQLKPEKLPQELREEVDAVIHGRGRLSARKPPKVRRERFMKAFDALLKDDWDDFHAINDELSDAELDLVAVLTPADLPLLRKVRRFAIAHATPHMAGLYDDLSRVIYTLTWQAH